MQAGRQKAMQDCREASKHACREAGMQAGMKEGKKADSKVYGHRSLLRPVFVRYTRTRNSVGRQAGRKQGRQASKGGGRKEGRQEGRHIGRKAGRHQGGREEGKHEGLRPLIPTSCCVRTVLVLVILLPRGVRYSTRTVLRPGDDAARPDAPPAPGHRACLLDDDDRPQHSFPRTSHQKTKTRNKTADVTWQCFGGDRIVTKEKHQSGFRKKYIGVANS